MKNITDYPTMSSFEIVINGIRSVYNSARTLEYDKRLNDYPLCPDGYGLIIIIVSYLLFASYVGPKIMKNRKPFDLRSPILVYNVIMVILNTYFFVESICAYEFGRALLNFSYPDSNAQLSLYEQRRLDFVYYYFVSKLVDMMDTNFFVLRKKWSQVSTLHLYHHASVPVCVWLALKFAPSAGVNGIFPIFNSIVHILMYTYYALSSFGPSVQKFLWWKRYITMIQLAQFVIFFVYALTYMFMQTGWPSILVCTSVAQPPLYLFMFTSFYFNTYCGKTSYKKIN